MNSGVMTEKVSTIRRSASAILALETGVCAELASVGLSHLTVRLGSDYAVYYAAARALRLDPAANIYQWSVIRSSMPALGACRLIPSPFVYPPLLAILLEPLSMLPCATSIHIWEALSALMLSSALYGLARIWRLEVGTFALLCGATLLSFPLLMGLWFGQIHILVLLGLVLALWRYDRGDDIGTGIIIAVLSWIQVIPGLFVIYFVVRRQWRVAISVLVSGALILLGMACVVGLQGMSNFLRSIAYTYTSNRVNTTNASLIASLGMWVAVLPAVVYLGIVWRYRGDQTLGYLWTIATMILLSPIVWAYFMLWLVPVFLFWWLQNQRWSRIFVVAAYIMLFWSNRVPAVPASITLAAWLGLGWLYIRSALAPANAVPVDADASSERRIRPAFRIGVWRFAAFVPLQRYARALTSGTSRGGRHGQK